MAQTIPTPAVERVLNNLLKVKALTAGGWIALCPVHNDKTASLKVDVGRDGRALIHCHAGCNSSDVMRALGLEMEDLFNEDLKANGNGNGDHHAAEPDPRNRSRLVKSYDYVDAGGNLLFEACRFEPKTFRQRRKDSEGNWIYNLQGVEPVLYRLPEVIEAAALGKTVHVVEGEKDVDALVALGLVATTNPMGAGKWRETYTKVLAGAAVVILPDNDEPGEKHAHHVAEQLTAAGSIVKILRLPGLPKKGDVSDWLSAGGTVHELQRLVAATSVFGPKKTVWKLSELLADDFVMRPPPPVVPRLAWSGRSTLLAAREKSGKSTLIGYVASRVSNGERFLGDECQKGDVLVVGLEEFIGDVARRLRHFGADPEHVFVMDSFQGDPAARPAEVRSVVQQLRPLLVIVDSLVAYAHGRGIDENDAAMIGVVQPLTDLAHETGAALVIVHHASKMDGRARGSTAITGATDVVVEFFPPDEDTDPTRRRMRSVGRVPVERQYDLRFDGQDYELTDGQEAPVETRIVALVTERPGISSNELFREIGGGRNRVLAAVNSLAAQRLIENTSGQSKRPKWSIPQSRLL